MDGKTNKNILIAVDESENARRAVLYVAGLLGGLSGFKVALVHVIPDPEEDYFQASSEKDRWLNEYRVRIRKVLEEYRGLLVESGFEEKSVSVHAPLRYCPSMAQCILKERDKNESATIVVGRQGMSRAEEFLFGSISNKIVQHAKDCTVWVVQ
jgi:nucleotide-binding universal stress UspA family protein